MRFPVTPSLTSIICICGKDSCPLFGLCHCGCGKKTKIAVRTTSRLNHRKGYPLRWIVGHNARLPVTIEFHRPFKIEDVYCRLIPLTQGQYAIVDAADYYWLTQYRWHAVWAKSTKSFYAVRHPEMINGKRGNLIPMHRDILGLCPDDDLEVDHDNHVTLDNRTKNIRPATHQQNQMHKRMSRLNLLRVKRVRYLDNAYVAFISINGKDVRLGSRKTPQEAHELYKEAALKHFGRFAQFE
jgi:HNH endonuclease